VTKDDVLFGYRVRLFAEAARTNMSAACRVFGVHRSTYYHWKRQVERRRPQMPNQLPKIIEERIVSFSIAHPGLVAQRRVEGRVEVHADPVAGATPRLPPPEATEHPILRSYRRPELPHRA